MNEALLVRFRSDDSMFFKGFSASYVALNPLQSEEISSEGSEAITPFPGSLKSIYRSFGGEIDGDDEDEDENNSNLNKIKYDKKSVFGEFIDWTKKKVDSQLYWLMLIMAIRFLICVIIDVMFNKINKFSEILTYKDCNFIISENVRRLARRYVFLMDNFFMCHNKP